MYKQKGNNIKFDHVNNILRVKSQGTLQHVVNYTNGVPCSVKYTKNNHICRGKTKNAFNADTRTRGISIICGKCKL